MSSVIPLSGEAHAMSFGIVGCGETNAILPEKSATSVTACPELISPCPEVDRREVPAQPARAIASNRVAEVREQQGISQRTMARRLGMDLKTYQALEAPDSDLRLSQLTQLQAALDVPLIDLLEDSQALSRPVAERAKMIKVMKTAVALKETSSNARVDRMVETLCSQLVDVMPELAEVSGWPQFGSRRGKSALGKALAQPICMADIGFPD